MAHVERSVPYVTIVPNDNVFVLCKKAVMFDAFVYTSTSKCLGIKAEVCQQRPYIATDQDRVPVA